MSKANFDHLVFAQNYAIKICAADLFREKDRIRNEEIEKNLWLHEKLQPKMLS